MFLIQLQTFPDILFAGSLVNTNRCSSSLKRSYKHIASNSHPWYLTLCVKECRRAFTMIPISGFWWRILGELHHRCLTQVPANFMSTVTKIKDQSSVSQTMQQNINSTPLSAATWETRRTLILGWNASPQGFRGLTKRTRQRWDFFKQNDQIDRSIWPRKNLKVFIDTEEMENDTLEEIYGLCRSVYSIDVDTHSLNCFFFFRGKLRLHQGPPKVVINSSSEDISLSIADEMPSRWEITKLWIKLSQAGRCSSVFIKAFLFACNPICKSKVPQKWPHKEEEEERT